MRLAIVMLTTTGLRRGELTRLTVGDYDPPQRTLAIRESKFHKSRLVPVSADTAHEIEHLIAVRGRRRLPTEADSPLLRHRSPRTGGYSGGGLSCAVRALFRRAGVRTATGHLPRTHDLRHGFAVTALLRWYAPDWTCSRSCPSWPPTWGTSRSSRPRTTFSLSSSGALHGTRTC